MEQSREAMQTDPVVSFPGYAWVAFRLATRLRLLPGGHFWRCQVTTAAKNTWRYMISLSSSGEFK